MNERELVDYADRLAKEREPGAPEQAVEIYLRLLEADPQNVELAMKAAETLYSCDDWGELSDEVYEKQLLSLQLAERAVALEPENAETHLILARLLWLWGENDQDYVTRAAREYDRSLELDPLNVWAAVGVANHARYLGITPDQAIQKLERARSGRPEQHILLHKLGQLYYEKGDKRKAVSVFEEALPLVPEGAKHEHTRKGLRGMIPRLKTAIKRETRAS